MYKFTNKNDFLQHFKITRFLITKLLRTNYNSVNFPYLKLYEVLIDDFNFIK